MSEQNAVPLIVLSAARDPVEVINGVLRRAGHAAHCTWIPALRDLGDALTQLNPELLIHASAPSDDLQCRRRRARSGAPTVPLVVVAESVNEARIADAMSRARAMWSPGQPRAPGGGDAARAARVPAGARAENHAASARDARRQLESVLQHSNDAIAQVQEGILVDANPSWLELFGFEDALVGQPIMDLFDETTHAGLEGRAGRLPAGALERSTLKAESRARRTARTLPVELVLALGEHDGDPCVRLIVASRKGRARKLEEDLADAVRRDPTTGLLYRRAAAGRAAGAPGQPVRRRHALFRGGQARQVRDRWSVMWACSPAKMC